MTEHSHTLKIDYSDDCDHEWFSTGLEFPWGELQLCSNCDADTYPRKQAQ